MKATKVVSENQVIAVRNIKAFSQVCDKPVKNQPVIVEKEYKYKDNLPANLQGINEAYEKYYAKLLNYCKKKVVNVIDAKTIVNNCFLAYYDHYFEFNPEKCSLNTFLFRILNNKIVDFWRNQQLFNKSTTYISSFVDYEEDREIFEIASNDYNIPENEDIMKNINHAVNNIKNTELRDILQLILIDGYEYQQVAEILNTNEASIRSLYSRARKLVANELGEIASLYGLFPKDKRVRINNKPEIAEMIEVFESNENEINIYENC
jgi:RNA polymerase sigma-70 factor (ECF subfamily)